MSDESIGRAEDAVNSNSRPSDLQITDMRLAVVCSNYDYPIIRIDTNQDIYGTGEVRDAGHKEDALQYKSQLLGQNPCNIDMIFRSIKQFGNWGRSGGGVSGIELALWDLIGKVYGVPCYQFLGGKYRDKVRLYADTPEPEEPTPEAYAERVKGRMDLGLTWDIEGHKRVTDAINVPTAAGEELYLWDGFREIIETRAVDIIHPDLLTSGGILETKKIADYAERYGLPTALHFAGSPIAFMANLHCAAAIPSFVALEHHGLDLPFWEGLVTGLPADYIEDGYVAVPEKPGLGVDLNYEGIEANLRFPGLFEPTDEWNNPKLDFWQPDRRWDK